MSKRAVVLGGEEKKARDLMQKINSIRKEKIPREKPRRMRNLKKIEKDC